MACRWGERSSAGPLAEASERISMSMTMEELAGGADSIELISEVHHNKRAVHSCWHAIPPLGFSSSRFTAVHDFGQQPSSYLVDCEL